MRSLDSKGGRYFLFYFFPNMMAYIETAKIYLTGMSLDSPGKLAKAISVCGAVLGFWGLNGVSTSRICRFLNRKERISAYRDFCIPKKSGGVRLISAPGKRLKLLQQAVSLMLQSVCEVSAAANGFVAGRSIATNAGVHLDSSVIFNCDLKDFFTSINKEMVVGALRRELKAFRPSDRVIRILSCLTTLPRPDGEEVLPQGAPTSPVVSNLVLKPLDRKLTEFAEKNGYRYSRYADDLTFSRRGPFNPALPIKTEAVLSIIREFGLSVNPRKTRLSLKSGRLEVTGLTVGRKINVDRRFVRQLRVLLHLWETRGFDEAQRIYNRDFRSGNETDLSLVVRGKINYMRMIKGSGDSTFRRFRFRYNRLKKRLKDPECPPAPPVLSGEEK